MASRVWCLIVGVVVLAMGLPVWAGTGGGGGMGGGGMGWGGTGIGGRSYGGDSSRGDNSTNKKSTEYIVAQSGDTEGQVTFEAIPSTDLRFRVSRAARTYRDALKDWTEQKKDTEKSGTKFTQAKPAKPFVQNFLDRTFPTLTVAQGLAEKCQERWDKQMAKKLGQDAGGKAIDEKIGAAPKGEKVVPDR